MTEFNDIVSLRLWPLKPPSVPLPCSKRGVHINRNRLVQSLYRLYRVVITGPEHYLSHCVPQACLLSQRLLRARRLAARSPVRN